MKTFFKILSWFWSVICGTFVYLYYFVEQLFEMLFVVAKWTLKIFVIVILLAFGAAADGIR